MHRRRVAVRSQPDRLAADARADACSSIAATRSPRPCSRTRAAKSSGSWPRSTRRAGCRTAPRRLAAPWRCCGLCRPRCVELPARAHRRIRRPVRCNSRGARRRQHLPAGTARKQNSMLRSYRGYCRQKRIHVSKRIRHRSRRHAFLNSDHQVDPFTDETLRRLEAEGVRFVIAGDGAPLLRGCGKRHSRSARHRRLPDHAYRQAGLHARGWHTRLLARTSIRPAVRRSSCSPDWQAARAGQDRQSAFPPTTPGMIDRHAPELLVFHQDSASSTR